jgi:hypothetical protein
VWSGAVQSAGDDMSAFRSAQFCVSCHRELTFRQYMRGDGVCRWCGHKGDGACTIADTYTRVYQVTPHGRVWWKPWTWLRTKRVFLIPERPET